MAIMPQTSPWEMAPGSALRKLDNVFSPNSAAGRPAAGVFKKSRKNGGKGRAFSRRLLFRALRRLLNRRISLRHGDPQRLAR